MAAVAPEPAAVGLGDLDRGVLRGLATFRWLAMAWAVAVLGVTRADLSRPAVAIGALAVAAAVCAGATVLVGRRDRRADGPVAVGVELVVGAGLLVGDGVAYGSAHGQSLGSVWPLAGVLLAGVGFGPRVAVAAGAAMGLARFGGALLAPWPEPSTLSLVSTGVLYVVAGLAAGLLAGRLRAAETAVARARAAEEAARAREDVARTLHDGVLQTLAVVQRRSGDAELAALARDQERELRSELFGVTHPDDDLLGALARVADRAERRHGLRHELSSVAAPGDLSPEVVGALASAVGEALTNAAKHGGAERAVIFVEADDAGTFVSVKDDGAGFDPSIITEGVGLSRSIRGRVGEVGGEVTLWATPGRGAEVELWVPGPLSGHL